MSTTRGVIDVKKKKGILRTSFPICEKKTLLLLAPEEGMGKGRSHNLNFHYVFRRKKKGNKALQYEGRDLLVTGRPLPSHLIRMGEGKTLWSRKRNSLALSRGENQSNYFYNDEGSAGLLASRLRGKRKNEFESITTEELERKGR